MALLQPRGPGIPGLPPTSLVSPVLICWCGFLLAPLERVFSFLRSWEARAGCLQESSPRFYLPHRSEPDRTKPKTMVHCAGCKRPILDRFLLNVLDRAWHVKCVQCCECKCNLTEKCFSREGKLYCKNDFFR